MEYDSDRYKSSLIDAARTSLPITIGLSDSSEAEGMLEYGLGVFLQAAGKPESVDVLYYCVRELVANAFKANAKRAFFAERKLSLDDQSDYEKGMKDFHREFHEGYFELNKQAARIGLKVRAELRLDGDSLTCAIYNSATLTEREAERISDRLRQARSFTSLEDAQAVMDSIEGAGLGLILLSLVLKKTGLPPTAFSIVAKGEETAARLVIPMNDLRLTGMEELSSRLVQYVDALPTMPDNLASLQSALADDDVNMASIANQIAADPSLTAYLLKVANSAAYQLIRRVSTVREAVTIIGIRGLRYLLLQYGVTLILGSKPIGAAEIWRRSNQVAFYARYLARRRDSFQSDADDALVGGVLHDMGMIIQYAVNSKLIRQIEAICRKRDIPLRLMEDIMTGLNHARIGGLLARKWNFPDVLIQEIEFHHRPWAAAPEYRRVVSLVYLAVCLCGVGDKRIEYRQIDGAILRENGIRNPAELDEMQDRISKAFSQAAASEGKSKSAG